MSGEPPAESAALIRQCAEVFGSPNGDCPIRQPLSPASALAWLAREAATPGRWRPPEQSLPDLGDFEIALVPITPGPNYLGACLTVFRALKPLGLDKKAAFLVGSDHFKDAATLGAIADEDAEIRFVPSSGIDSLSPAALRRAGERLAKLLRENEVGDHFTFAHADLVLRHLAKVATAEKWLQRSKLKLVITPNDQMAEAGWLIPAARRCGIRTAQFQHGVLNAWNWPFASDETWVWDKQSARAFESFGAPAARLREVGVLEPGLTAASPDTAPKRRRDPSAPLRLLFLSQTAAEQESGLDGYAHPADDLAAILRDARTPCDLWVRLHPRDRDAAIDYLEARLRPVAANLTFCPRDEALGASLAKADAVLTGASTAALAAVSRGIPTALLWNDRLQEYCGQPFLPPEQVIATKAEGLAWLQGIPDAARVSADFTIRDGAPIAAELVATLLNDRESCRAR